MPTHKLDKAVRKAILDARKMIEGVAKADGNEAETRRRVERIFDSLMGYDVLKHISREYAIHGIGDTEHCDFAIQLDCNDGSNPDMLIELKRVNVNLTQKHLKQAASYAINIGCEWTLLTNGKDWKLYHVSFTQPPQTKLLEHWNLITDETATLASKFNLICYKNIKRGGLTHLWEKSNVLTAHNMLGTILSEDSIKLIRRNLKKTTDVTVSPEEIIGAVRRLLNETALNEMEKIKISFPDKKKARKKAPTKIVEKQEEPPAQS